MTTLGSQSRLEEGHYVHHFSVNPKNIEDDVQRIVITDSKDIDVDKINVAGVVNVISVSDDGAINFLK